MDLAHIEQSLIAARDELLTYWEQPEGQACLLVLRVAADAFADYRAVDAVTARRADPGAWQRIEALAGEIARLRAPLETTT